MDLLSERDFDCEGAPDTVNECDAVPVAVTVGLNVSESEKECDLDELGASVRDTDIDGEIVMLVE